MKILVIPDVHLKPWMFDRASKMMKAGKADRAVCLMDIPDDWDREMDVALYSETYDAAIAFARSFDAGSEDSSSSVLIFLNASNSSERICSS